MRLFPSTAAFSRAFFRLLFVTVITIAVACVFMAQSGHAESQLTPSDRVVAVVNGHQITARELYAYVMTGGRPEQETLEDVINLYLIREAAATYSVEAPTGSWSKEMRAGIEFSLASMMALDIPPTQVTLVVDHAWLKDAETEKELMDGRGLMARLRDMVASGIPIPQAFVRLKLDGAMWHIGDHEEYPYEVIPEEARDLKPGTLSPIIPGDGGVHLFWLHRKKEEKPSAETVRTVLNARLREGATIEYAEPPPR